MTDPPEAPEPQEPRLTVEERIASADRTGDTELRRLARVNQFGLTPRKWRKLGS